MDGPRERGWPGDHLRGGAVGGRRAGRRGGAAGVRAVVAGAAGGRRPRWGGGGGGPPGAGAARAGLRRTDTVRLPEVSERDLVRHYTRLAHRNYAVDLGFYPLGSCTMKYNPKVAEAAAALPGFARLHPAQPAEQVQGALELLARLEHALCQLTGLAAATFQPAAG